jgi:hypothetical protein
MPRESGANMLNFGSQRQAAIAVLWSVRGLDTESDMEGRTFRRSRASEPRLRVPC